jgi:hypothetical protein
MLDQLDYIYYRNTDRASSPSFFRELQDLEEKGLPNVRERILVSDRCHIVLDLHVLVDGLEESELGSREIPLNIFAVLISY